MTRGFRRGQNLAEYALIIGVVSLALVAMQTYFKRGIQSIVKVSADELSRNATKFYCDTYRDIDGQTLGSISTSMLEYSSSGANISAAKKIRVQESSDGGFVKETDIEKDTSKFTSEFKYTSGYNPGIKTSESGTTGNQKQPVEPAKEP